MATAIGAIARECIHIVSVHMGCDLVERIANTSRLGSAVAGALVLLYFKSCVHHTAMCMARFTKVYYYTLAIPINIDRHKAYIEEYKCRCT